MNDQPGQTPDPIRGDSEAIGNTEVENAPRDFSQVISDRARDMPDRIAVYQQNGKLTFSQLDDLVTRCAGVLDDLGVAKHGTCALAFDDELTLLIVWLATARIRVTPVSLDPASVPSQWADASELCQMSMLIADRTFDVAGLYSDLVTLETIKAAPLRPLSELGQGKGRYDILHIGSGSTGAPKAIALPFGGIDQQCRLTIDSWGFAEGDVFFSFVKASFVSGLRIGLAALAAGGAIFLRGTDAAIALDAFDRCRINKVYSPAVFAERLIGVLQQKKRRLGDHVKYRISSSVITDDLVQRAREHISENVEILYGTNETAEMSALPRAWENRPSGSVGFIQSLAEVEVVNEHEMPVSAGEAGQIRVKTPGMFCEYFDNPDATRKALRDGWFYPGDLAKLTAEGHLILLGRSDHMMIFDGMNIYPAEIETIMADHPAVKDLAVMPVKHRIHLDVPVCAVQLYPDQAVTEQELVDFGKERLGAKAATFVFVVDRIPRNDLGKLIRSDMMDVLIGKIRQLPE